MEYNFRKIEQHWKEQWKKDKVYQVPNPPTATALPPADKPASVAGESGTLKPKCYVLDMFPYPSGVGLHVGHPLGYIASDIYARYKRLKGFNVLHTMGYDAFGLPAEQYAIEHGIHPADSTETNINNFRKQMDNVGFSFDWDREIRTSDPSYYKWTQWIFLQLFGSFFNRQSKKAERISVLVNAFEKEGNKTHPCPGDPTLQFTSDEWENFDEARKMDVLMQYRLAYCGFGEVNWCEALGTVLANDEVINGVSERGGYPVVKKKLRQWYLRITEYADRLLEGLERVDFSDAMKEMQTNWIGKSSGAEIDFAIAGKREKLRVYTTRPDTIFGVDFMVIAPEHELVEEITTAEQKQAVEDYITYVKSRSERERMAEKKISGVFTGAYALNPFNQQKIPVWISEYVLAGYGTGAIMAVPCGDERDHKFARHFNIPITNIIGKHYNGEEANPTKDAVLENSDFLNGIIMKDAIEVVIKKIEQEGIGIRKVNFKMRDAAFSRQRYWGEPFPIKWIDGVAYPLDEKELPLELPHVDSYKPGPEGEGPLANIKAWTDRHLETNTMPGYAGSSWYFLRYMDPHNDKAFCDRKISDYWNQVDLYIGGTEHAVGHLLYSRMWTKVLFDLDYIGFDEPYKKLVNQGMIQGRSIIIYRLASYFENNSKRNMQSSQKIFFSAELHDKYVSGKTSVQDIDNLFVSIAGFSMLKQIKDGSERLTKFVREDGDPLLINTFRPLPIVPNFSIKFAEIHIDINLADKNDCIDIEKLRESREEFNKGIFLTENDKFVGGTIVEKMSKRYLNVVNPDDIVAQYGADTFRMYEMFLGPVEMSKPWDTKGIEGVYKFLRKLWRLFFDEVKGKVWNDDKPTDAELKVLHRAIKKIEDDTERFSFNTGVSGFMIAVNELTDLKCNKKKVLESLLILLAPYAPHIAEQLWHELGNTSTILDASYPVFEGKYVTESSKDYPISVNGKTRTTMNISLDAAQPDVEKIVLENEVIKKWLEGKAPKKIIYVKGKMVNVVV